MTSDNIAAHLSAIMYSVVHGMTPKQTIEKISLTQQYRSMNRSRINGIEDFQRNGKRVALKEGQPTELNKRILQTVPYVIGGDRQCS